MMLATNLEALLGTEIWECAIRLGKALIKIDQLVHDPQTAICISGDCKAMAYDISRSLVEAHMAESQDERISRLQSLLDRVRTVDDRLDLNASDNMKAARVLVQAYMEADALREHLCVAIKDEESMVRAA